MTCREVPAIALALDGVGDWRNTSAAREKAFDAIDAYVSQRVQAAREEALQALEQICSLPDHMEKYELGSELGEAYLDGLKAAVEVAERAWLRPQESPK
jgi:hypothetical protein